MSGGQPASRTTTLNRRKMHALESSSKLTTSSVPRLCSAGKRSPGAGSASSSVCLYTRPIGSPLSE